MRRFLRKDGHHSEEGHYEVFIDPSRVVALEASDEVDKAGWRYYTVVLLEGGHKVYVCGSRKDVMKKLGEAEES